jgi:DNA invertase Pin-like site-specific DNA recombinase
VTRTAEDIRPALYARISKDDLGKPELGVKRQQRSCEELAERQGWPKPVAYVDNNRSASLEVTTRPQFDRLCVDLASGTVNKLIVLGQDRLCRKPEELEASMRILRKQGITEIFTVKDGTLNIGSTQGRTMARVKGAFDIGYAEYISELCRLKKDELATSGVPAGGGNRPFGYSRSCTPKLDRPCRIPGCVHDHQRSMIPAEAALIREAARRVLAGEGLGAICRDWNERAISTVTGTAWSPNVLCAILTVPRTAGLRQHRGEVVGKAAWPAILDRDTWERVRAVFEARKGTKVVRGAALLTGVLRCSRCGVHLNRSGPVYKCMKAPGKRGCGRLAVKAEPVDTLIVEAVLTALDTPALAAAVGAWRPPAVDIAAIEADLDRMAALRGAGTISEREWLAVRRPLVTRLEAARGQAAAASTADPIAPYVGQPGLLRKRWPKLTTGQQRAVVGAVIDRIEVRPGMKGKRFDPVAESQGRGRLEITWRA